MVGVLAVGFVANLLVRPVAERFHEPDTAGADATSATVDTSSGGGVSTMTRTQAPVRTQARPVLLAAAWLVVGVPLAYGVYATLVKTVSLFG